ncbi:MAG: hypothetical protein ACSLEM_05925 [Candidatus Malihini olakiniferum]
MHVIATISGDAKNIQAILDKGITFHTRLDGDKVVKPESGLRGQYTPPRLLEQNKKQNIMLNLNIQDGQQSGSHQP